jgi:hypothetical protein
MKHSWVYVLPLCALMLAPVNADPLPSPAPATPASAAPAFAVSPPSGPAAAGGGHAYDPCALLSQQDVASAAGVAANQVLTPTSPTKDECVWAIGSKAGVPGQQVALTLRTIEGVKHSRGLATFTALIGVLQSVPGVRAVNNPIVTSAFADAQVVANLGDQAGWKNGSLSVLKNELLFHVSVTGQSSGATSLNVATSVAHSVLLHLQTL